MLCLIYPVEVRKEDRTSAQGDTQPQTVHDFCVVVRIRIGSVRDGTSSSAQFHLSVSCLFLFLFV